MNWMYALYATYEQNRDYVGRIDKEPAHGNRKERLITPPSAAVPQHAECSHHHHTEQTGRAN